MSNLVKWEPSTFEGLGHFVDEASSGGFYKFKDGDNVLRVMPARLGERWCQEVWEHYITPPGGGQTVTFVCPLKMSRGEKRCPACARAEELRRTGKPADAQRAKDYSAKPRLYFNIIDRDNEAGGPQKVGVGVMISREMDKIAKSKRGGDFTNPTDQGFDLVIFKQGSGRDTEYTVQMDRGVRPLSEDPKLTSMWISGQADLREHAVYKSEKEILAMFGGRDEDDEDDAPPARGKTIRAERADRPRKSDADLDATDEDGPGF